MAHVGRVGVGQAVAVCTGATVVARIGAVVVGFAIIKLLRPEELGLFLGTQALVFAGCGLCDLGLSHGYRMMVSRTHALRERLLGPTLAVQAAALLIYFVGLAAYLGMAGRLTPSVALVALGALAAQWLALPNIDLKIFARFGKSGLLTLLPMVALAGAALFCALSDQRFEALALGYAIGMVTSATVGIRFVGLEAVHLRFDREYLALVRTSLPFFFSILAYRFSQHWGLSYVLVTQGETAAGVVALPLKLYQLPLVITIATTSVTLPMFHRIAQTATSQRFGAVLGRLIRPLWALGGAAAGVYALCPEVIVDSLASSEYTASVPLVRVVAVAVLFRVLTVPAENTLESHDLQWIRLAGQVAGTVMLVVGVISLLPQYGVISLTYALLGMDLFFFLWCWGFSALRLGRALPYGVHLRASCAFAISLGLAFACGWGGVLRAGYFVACYFALLTAFRVWTVQDALDALRARS